MKNVNINLVNGDSDGSIIISSSSKIRTVRVEKADVAAYNSELNGPGVYFLLIGNDEIYVGQSAIDPIAKRVMNTHSGSIDSLWHTVVGFVFPPKSIGTNELLYLENAMCEYVYQNYTKCWTSSPAQKNCNEAYRNSHYGLSMGQIATCEDYVRDIEFYISLFWKGLFPATTPKHVPSSTPAPTPKPPVNTATFYFKNPKRDVDGKAEIAIHTGDTTKRETVLKSGSKISIDVSDHFKSAARVKAYRDKLISSGKIKDRVLQEDVIFDSQSGAGEFLNGTAFDGNGSWKRVEDDVPLKTLLK